MDEKKLSEKEALEIVARVFDRNMRRMNYVRGELFIFWGALMALTALAEYGLFRWTGDMRVLWSWLLPLAGGIVWMIRDDRRRQLARTGFDDLLILIWSIPAVVSVFVFIYTLATPENTMNPVGITQLMLATALIITAEFFRGKGSQHTGSFVALLGMGFFGLISAFNITYRQPFDPVSGQWMLLLAGTSVLLLFLPGFILRHITRKQCSKS